MATANFYLYDSRATKETRIILRFRYPQGNISYSTRQKVHPKFWNKKRQRIKSTPQFPQGQSINKVLNKLQSEVYRIYNDLIYQDITPSNQILVEKLNEVLKIDSSRFKMPQITHKTFLELLELLIYETEHGIRVKKNGNKIRESTIKGYRTLLKHLRNFTRLKKFPLKILTMDSSSPCKFQTR